MAVENCTNQNHSKMNVTVRFCAVCSEIVNNKIPKKNCSNAEHARNRKSGMHFCVDCGTDLKSSV